MTKASPQRREMERRNRIRLSIAAHAYEKHDHSVMSDAEYDALSKQIDVSTPTGNRRMDNFFRKHFTHDTGMWIHAHPERHMLEAIYQRYHKEQRT